MGCDVREVQGANNRPAHGGLHQARASDDLSLEPAAGSDGRQFRKIFAADRIRIFGPLRDGVRLGGFGLLARIGPGFEV